MAILGLVKTDDNGDMEHLQSLLGTYGIIFVINLLYDIITLGGIGGLSLLIMGDSLVRATFITLVIYAGNKGIQWKQQE